MKEGLEWFKEARYGLFIHYGLYSMLGRGEWVLNRENIPLDEYKKHAEKFTAENFDADELIRKAKEDWGMQYAVLTTKHHEGFCLYDSKITDFNSVNAAAGRDLVQEFVDACRKHDMKIGLYHSLNNWTAKPDATDALENKEDYQKFIDYTHSQILEIMSNYGKIDILWYDGWWPFDKHGWQSEKLQAEVDKLQPGILINGRSGLEGDFKTPEGHIQASDDVWEACMTLNNCWGFTSGDHHWKPALDVCSMLQQASAGQGNLLLNVGPRGDGSIPEESVKILDEVGTWISQNKEALYNTQKFYFDCHTRGTGRSEWTNFGSFTGAENALYLHVKNWPGTELILTGVDCNVIDVSFLATGDKINFKQTADKVVLSQLPEVMDTTTPVIIKYTTSDQAKLYKTGGVRIPQVPHCHYDPLPPDIKY